MSLTGYLWKKKVRKDWLCGRVGTYLLLVDLFSSIQALITHPYTRCQYTFFQKQLYAIWIKSEEPFFGKEEKLERNIIWLNGPKFVKTTRKGGLGIKDIRKINISLLCKWWWRLDNEQGLWQDIIKFKYLRGKSICTVTHRQTDSPIWADLLKIREVYLQGRKLNVKNGEKNFILEGQLVI
jgi:hypothetical protein